VFVQIDHGVTVNWQVSLAGEAVRVPEGEPGEVQDTDDRSVTLPEAPKSVTPLGAVTP
jgi:hypothetical protein